MHAIARMIGLTAIIVLTADGCAPQSEVVKLYDDPARGPKTYEKLLVVEISSDRNLQQLFEDEISLRIREKQADAIPSYTLIDSSNGLRQDDIDRVSKEIGADGILITHIVSIETDVDVKEGRKDIRTTCRGGDLADYFLYDHEILSEPDSVGVSHTVIVITNLYDAKSRKRIWTIQSTCFEKAELSDAMRDEAIAIARQLRIDQLI